MATATDETGVVTLPGADALSLACAMVTSLARGDILLSVRNRLVEVRWSAGVTEGPAAGVIGAPEGHPFWHVDGVVSVFAIGSVR